MVRFGRAVVLLILVFPVGPAAAQPARSVEIFGGYSLLPANGDDFPRGTSHGVQASVTANLNRWFGIVGDFGAQFDKNSDLGPGFQGLTAETRVVQFLAGPRFAARSDNATLFVHGLVGIASGDAGETFSGFSDTKLAFGAGVGLDVYFHRSVAVRGQFDLLASFADIVEVNPRWGLGVVMRLGGS